MSASCRAIGVEALLKLLRQPTVEAKQRAQAGRSLASLGDPRPEVMTLDSMELCQVPAGPFLMGSGSDDEMALDREKPAHELDLDYDFYLARFPVTVAQFQEYVDLTQTEPGVLALKDPANQPVRFVSWHEACSFCDWLTGRWQAKGWLAEGWVARLPTEAEWEKAARGGLEVPLGPMISTAACLGKSDSEPSSALRPNDCPDRRFPWGQEVDLNRANQRETEIGRPSAAGCFPTGDSPYGCEELSGNVWEWTLSAWGEDWKKLFRYPYNPLDGREIMQNSQFLRVLRGGSFFNDPGIVRCACRYGYDPESRDDDVGFRVGLFPFSLASQISGL